MRKANINRDSAALFFLEAIGIDSGQRFDQSGFSVVDVAGRPHDYRLHKKK
jgi:hypothetical protein